MERLMEEQRSYICDTDDTKFGICLSSCWDNSPETRDCFRYMTLLIIIGIAAIIYGDFCLVRVSPLEWLYRKLENKLQLKKKEQKRMNHNNKKVWDFLKVERLKDNFVLDVDDENVQHPYQDSIQQKVITFKNFNASQFIFSVASIPNILQYALSFQYTHAVFVGSIGWGCLSSAFAMYLYQIIAWEEYCDVLSSGEKGPIQLYINTLSGFFASLLRNVWLLPSFLMFGYVSTVNSRWNSVLSNVSSLSQGIRDAGIYFAKDATYPDEEDREYLFNIYRLLNASHFYCYERIAWNNNNNEEEGEDSSSYFSLDNMVQKGLLTEQEASKIQKMQSRQPETFKTFEFIYTTCETIMETYAKKKDLYWSGGFSDVWRSGRKMQNFPNTDQPNIYRHVMFFVVTILIVFLVVGEAFAKLVYIPVNSDITMQEFYQDKGSFMMLWFVPTCYQSLPLLAVAFQTTTIRVIFIMMYSLSDPFRMRKEDKNNTNDTFTVDNELAETELFLFQLLRSNFVKSDEEEGEGEDKVEVLMTKESTEKPCIEVTAP